MSVSTNELKNGMTLELDGTLFQVIEFQHVKPGKGGAFVRTKLRNLKTGAVAEKTFNAGVKVGLAIVERKDMQYLYGDGEDYVFMDLETYDQIHVPGALVGDAGGYLVEGGQAQVTVHEGVPIGVDLPASMVLTDHRDGPGREGRHADRRLQAGEARDRDRRAGAALRGGGREDQGRHADGRVHRAREGVTNRREARRTALDILYQSDITETPGDAVLADWREAGRSVSPFAEELVRGVQDHLSEIDPLLEEHSEGWTVARMATLDRTIMRVAVFELMHRPDIPTSVAISEAVEAATELSSDESRRYVNGILGRIARELGRPGTGPQTQVDAGAD